MFDLAMLGGELGKSLLVKLVWLALAYSSLHKSVVKFRYCLRKHRVMKAWRNRSRHE
jgi:hypothetical protein